METQKEFESDALLVQLVKLRLISERVNDLPWSSDVADIDTTMKAPAMFYLKSLEIKCSSRISNLTFPVNFRTIVSNFQFDLIVNSRIL
jgi:hypothetical protein